MALSPHKRGKRHFRGNNPEAGGRTKAGTVANMTEFLAGMALRRAGKNPAGGGQHGCNEKQGMLEGPNLLGR